MLQAQASRASWDRQWASNRRIQQSVDIVSSILEFGTVDTFWKKGGGRGGSGVLEDASSGHSLDKLGARGDLSDP